MKIINAARFSGALFLIAGIYAFFVMRTGFQSTAPVLARQAWFAAYTPLWIIGGWLWLLAIFCIESRREGQKEEQGHEAP